jgi:threonine/homoserine/homoserine lactone efflux protein
MDARHSHAQNRSTMDPVLTLFGQSMLIGLSIAAPVGQIGVLAIQRTVDHGRAAGLATGLGAAFADAVYGAVGAFGVTSLIAWLVAAKWWLGLAGSALLLAMAWRIVRAPASTGNVASATASGTASGTQPLARYVAGTFALTLSNPTTILSFIAVFGALAGRAPSASPWAMVAGVLVGSAAWWLVLSAAVDRMRHVLDARWHRRINMGSAGLLAGFAAWQLVALATS